MNENKSLVAAIMTQLGKSAEKINQVKEIVIKHTPEEWITLDKLCAKIHKESPETIKDISIDDISYATGHMIGISVQLGTPCEIEHKKIEDGDDPYYMIRRTQTDETPQGTELSL